MVKFEEDLQKECLAGWEDNYLDYKKLKGFRVR